MFVLERRKFSLRKVAEDHPASRWKVYIWILDAHDVPLRLYERHNLAMWSQKIAGGLHPASQPAMYAGVFFEKHTTLQR